MPPLDKLSGTLGRENATHLLRRATFGPTKSDIDTFSTLTVDQAMNTLFQVQSMPAPPIDPKTGSTWLNPKAGDTNSDQKKLTQVFMAWHLEQMRNSGTNIRERITFFFHTHLPVRRTLVTASEMLYYQNSLYRHYALGNFKELFRKICVDNAMLIYLDNGINDKQNPNENFAREMFELYSIGRGEQDGERSYTNYTEEDVVAATRVLTGWQVDEDLINIDENGIPLGKLRTLESGGQTVANRHDSGAKVFSSKFGGITIQPEGSLVGEYATVEQAEKELDDLMDLIFNEDETARFIVRKLYRHFVYYKIDSSVETNIIIPLATAFKSSGYDIPTVLKQLLSSKHFYDVESDPANDDIKGAMIKSPVEIVLGTARLLEAEFPADYLSAYLETEENTKSGLINLLIQQGINFYEPFEVAGYPAYHQFPAYNRNWITPYYLVYRYKTADYLIYNSPFEGDALNITVDILSWVKNNITAPSDADKLVTEVLDLMVPYKLDTVSTDRYNYFVQVFLDTGEKYQWTNAWNAYIASPTPTNEESVKVPLLRLVSKLIQTPEYQLH